MLVHFSNFPNGDSVIAKITEEQWNLLEWLEERGVFTDFAFDEVGVEDLS